MEPPKVEIRKRTLSGDEVARTLSFGIKPAKIIEVFDSYAATKLGTNRSLAVSALMIYAMKNSEVKKLIQDLQKILKDIDNRRVDIKPSF